MYNEQVNRNEQVNGSEQSDKNAQKVKNWGIGFKKLPSKTSRKPRS